MHETHLCLLLPEKKLNELLFIGGEAVEKCKSCRRLLFEQLIFGAQLFLSLEHHEPRLVLVVRFFARFWVDILCFIVIC
jgi:hypothetical protein